MADFEFKEIGKLGKSILIQEMKGNDNLYFRVTKLYKTQDGEWRPTKQGVSIPLSECALLRDLLDDFIKKNGSPVSDTKQVYGSDITDIE